MNSPVMRRFATALWTDERHMRIRLQSWSMSLVLYVACAGVVGLFSTWGVVSGGQVAAWLGVVLGGLGVFHVLIRSGWSQRLADPAMSRQQIVFGIFTVAAGYLTAGELRSAVLLPLMLIMIFGTFSVSFRDMAGLTALALAILGGTMLAMHTVWPGRYSTVVDLVNLFMCAINLPASSAFAMLLGSLRARLSKQRAELQTALARIQDLATLDDLTGLANRRRAQEMLSAEVTRGQRAVHPFAVALIDLDRFKRLNDRFGHAGGDDVLCRFADEARACVRGADMVSRWGGEEFLILMPETDEAEAMGAIDRLRQRVEALSITSAQGDMRFTFSAGVASYVSGDSVAATVARADRALYRAKAAGRNRIELADDSDNQAPDDLAASALEAVTALRSNKPLAELPATAPSRPRSPAATDESPAADSEAAARH